jgi:hypothetical protein
MEEDLANMSREQLIDEVQKLQHGLRHWASPTSGMPWGRL